METGEYERGMEFCEQFNRLGFEDKEVSHMIYKIKMVGGRVTHSSKIKKNRSRSY